jgi:hypothetical protein
MIAKPLRDRLSKQIQSEITTARLYKQSRITSWNKNENMYYGRKEMTDDSSANVDIGKMQEHVHTFLSKVDSPLIFKYGKKKESELKKAKYLNALREQDANQGDWDMIDLLGKKQCAIYGRAVFSFHVETDPEWNPILENVDVKTFLMDRRAGGRDLEKAFYMGDWGITLSRTQLKNGVKKGIYARESVKDTLDRRDGGKKNKEDIDVSNRYAAITSGQTIDQTADVETSEGYRFWRWVTTMDGVRYYVVMDNDGNVIRAEELTELFESNQWPYWSYAAYPDMTEFWTPSICDYVRELFLAQAKSINQMLDNAEQIIKPQKAVFHRYILNKAQLKYMRNGIIDIDDNNGQITDINKVFQTVAVPSINTPLQVYDKLDMIGSIGSGITQDAKGVSAEKTLGIYEGNQANIADRFGLFNKSYSHGYKRFAKLYYHGVMENMTRKVSVEMLGPDGVEFTALSRRDIKPSNGFKIIVEASNAETQSDQKDKSNKLTFLSNNAQNPAQSPKKAYELGARIANFSEDEIKELQDVENYGSTELMSEAALNIENVLKGVSVRPNAQSNPAYIQKIKDYIENHQDELKTEEFVRLTEYFDACAQVSEKNIARMAMMAKPMTDPNAPIDPNAPPTSPMPPGAPTPPSPGLPVQPYQ